MTALTYDALLRRLDDVIEMEANGEATEADVVAAFEEFQIGLRDHAEVLAAMVKRAEMKKKEAADRKAKWAGREKRYTKRGEWLRAELLRTMEELGSRKIEGDYTISLVDDSEAKRVEILVDDAESVHKAFPELVRVETHTEYVFDQEAILAAIEGGLVAELNGVPVAKLVPKTREHVTIR